MKKITRADLVQFANHIVTERKKLLVALFIISLAAIATGTVRLLERKFSFDIGVLTHLSPKIAIVAVTVGGVLFSLSLIVVCLGKGSSQEKIESKRVRIEETDWKRIKQIGAEFSGSACQHLKERKNKRELKQNKKYIYHTYIPLSVGGFVRLVWDKGISMRIWGLECNPDFIRIEGIGNNPGTFLKDWHEEKFHIYRHYTEPEMIDGNEECDVIWLSNSLLEQMARENSTMLQLF